MKDERRLIMRPEKRGESTLLLSPAVGLFTCARFPGEVLVAGQRAGALDCLGVPHQLLVPAGVSGRIVSPPPERVHEPVGYGSVLYELIPLAAAGEHEDTPAEDAAAGADLAVLAPYSGRFWHRPSPGDPPFLSVGDVIAEGDRLGLIEVMKTFTHLYYEPGPGLPTRARVLRLLAADGDEVASDQPLLAIEAE